jgi:hypothetical protein
MRKFICIGKKLSICELRLLLCLLVLGMLVSTAAASEGTFPSWNFQQTGFASYTGGPIQTAVAMRDGRVWPVVFAEDSSRRVQAYSLYPVKNPTTSTNWFQIGTNLINDTGSGMLSAATSPDGRFGVALTFVGSANSTAVVGSSLTGFGGAMTGVQAIDFDRNGNLVKGTLNTLPVIQGVSPGSLVDIAVSTMGDIGAVDANFKYYQNSLLLGGWGSVDLKQIATTVQVPISNTLNLAIDSVGRPHIVGLRYGSPEKELARISHHPYRKRLPFVA